MLHRLTNNILISTWQRMSRLLPPSGKRALWMQVFLTIGGGFLEVAGLALLVPLLVIAQKPQLIHSNSTLAWLYDQFGFTTDSAFMLFLVGIVFFTFVVKNLISMWIIHRQTKFAFDISLELTQKEYWKQLDQGFLYLKSKGSTVVIYNIFNVPGYFAWGVVLPFVTILSEVAVLLMIVLSILFYSPLLLLAVILVMVPAGLITYNSTKNKLYQLGQERETRYKESFETLSRAIHGYTDLKLSGKEQSFLDQYLAGFRRLNQNQKVQAFLSYLPARFLEVFAVMGIVLIFLFTILVASDQARLFEFLGIFAAAAFRMMPSMNRVLMALMSVKNHQPTFDLLEADGEKPEEGRAKIVPVSFKESITFRGVKVRYAGATGDALSGADLTVKKGEKVGIIGESGSGKTTLMNVLLRFVAESEGELLIDGVKMTSKDTKGLRSLIGYVQQGVFLMDDTLRRNIAYGESDSQINEQALQQAIDDASLRKLVDSLPNGVNEKLGELGSKLSGGQKQRIGIARALYRNSEILVFDEATSALDMETEREVTEAIDNLSGINKTILIVAHRITTLRGCDRIIEMKEGKVAATWNYEDLIKAKIN
jgi:ATP-binding cassette, subfamily B, bacterial PglK